MFLIAATLGAFTLGLGAFVAGIVFSFKYNSIYIKDLLEKGYTALNKSEADKLIQAGIIQSTQEAAIETKKTEEVTAKETSN